MALLEASTGQNDPNSIYGSGLLGTLNSLTNTAGQVYNTVQQVRGKTPTPGATPVAAPAANPAPAAATSGWKKYLPWIIGGAGLLLVLAFVLRK